jgi:hypothetical protein
MKKDYHNLYKRYFYCENMVKMLVIHKVADFDEWKDSFDKALPMRKKGGEKSVKILKDKNVEGGIIGLFDWTSEEDAKEFMMSPEIQEKMKEAGVISEPKIFFLDEVKVRAK